MEDIGHIGPIVVPEGADEFLPSRRNGISMIEYQQVLKEAYNRYQELVTEDNKKPADKRLGIEEVGCVVFVACLLHTHLRIPINYRLVQRGMKANVGTSMETIERMLKDSGIEYQEHSFESQDLVKSKRAVMDKINSIAKKSHCAILSTFMLDEEGNPIYSHASAVLPSETGNPWIADCNGEFRDLFLNPYVYSTFLIEITSDRLPLPPRELRGGRKKTKRRSKKTRRRK